MSMQIKQRILVMIVIAACAGAAQAFDERVEFLGDYVNVKSATGEHCDGYSVMIWKYKGSLVGLLNHHRGLCGDPPMGVMEETVYSEQSGSLSFQAKLSDGCAFQADTCIPTKDLVVFKGSLRGQRLEGVVTWIRDGKMQAAYSEDVVLSKDPRQSLWRDYET